MRGAFTVTWLVASALVAGCATQTSLTRVAMQPMALTQEGVAPYRWIVCDAGRDCRPSTVKTVTTITPPRPSLVQQVRPQAVPVPLPEATVTKPVSAPELKTLVVNFEVNSSFLTATARGLLDELRPVGESMVQVRGYTDSTGSTEYNAWLAARRAQRVKEYVMSTGVEPKQVRIEAMGECCFIASNGTPEGRSANRRVEVVINGR